MNFFSSIVIRVLDIMLSTIFLIFLSPVIIGISLCILFKNGRPILFIQPRVGKNCKSFKILKFRTMHHTSGIFNPASIGASGDIDDRAKYITTSLNDTRITNIGRLLRRSHLDELPQMINVLKGEMSMVGPRPDALVQRFDYDQVFWELRHKERPGITGLAQLVQVESLQHRLELDLECIDNSSVSTYIKILYRTVYKVFKLSSI